MADVFISYTSEDRQKAQQLARVLEEKGWSVWWDSKVTPGKTYSDVVDQALNDSHCVIVLWSEKSVQKKWVRKEAAEGKRRGILVLALLEDIDISHVPSEFRLIEAVRLTDWRGEAFHPQLDRLLHSVESHTGDPTASQIFRPELPQPTAPKRLSWSRGAIVLGIVLVAGYLILRNCTFQ